MNDIGTQIGRLPRENFRAPRTNDRHLPGFVRFVKGCPYNFLRNAPVLERNDIRPERQNAPGPFARLVGGF